MKLLQKISFKYTVINKYKIMIKFFIDTEHNFSLHVDVLKSLKVIEQ